MSGTIKKSLHAFLWVWVYLPNSYELWLDSTSVNGASEVRVHSQYNTVHFNADSGLCTINAPPKIMSVIIVNEKQSTFICALRCNYKGMAIHCNIWSAFFVCYYNLIIRIMMGIIRCVVLRP